jgi:hypothetical protein
MKCRMLFGLRLLLALLLLAAGSGQTGGLDVVVQHIQAAGPRQWLSLMASSIVWRAPVIARALPDRSAPFIHGEAADGHTA